MTWGRLITDMSTREFTHWMAFYNLENRERKRAQEDAEDKANAQRVARRMAGLR